MKVAAKIAAIEIARYEVRVAVVKTGGKRPRILEVHSAVAGPVVDEGDRHAALVAALKQAVEQVKSKPAGYVLVVPSEWSITRHLRIPFKGRSRVASAVQFELEPFLAFPIEELVVDHLNVREIDGETDVLAVGIRREIIAEQMAVLEEAGVAVSGVSVDAVGLTCLWRDQAGPLQGLNAVLHVREQGSILAVLHDKQLAFIRHLSLPAERLHEQPKAAGKEVQTILRAIASQWQGDDEIASLTVTGVEVFEEARELFAEGVGVPVQTRNLLAELPGAEKPGEGVLPEERWAAAVGAASAAAGGAFSLDFLRDEFGVRRGSRRLLTHVVFSAAMLALAACAYAVYVYFDYRQNQQEIDRLGQQVWDIYAATFPNGALQARPSDDIGGFVSFETMQQEAEAERRQGAALSVDFFNQPPLLEILQVLAQTMPDNQMALTEFRLASGRESEIIMTGEIRDTTAFNEVERRLNESEILEIKGEASRTSAGGKETFIIRAVPE